MVPVDDARMGHTAKGLADGVGQLLDSFGDGFFIDSVKPVDREQDGLRIFADFPIIALAPGPAPGLYGMAADIDQFPFVRLFQLATAHR